VLGRIYASVDEGYMLLKMLKKVLGVMQYIQKYLEAKTGQEILGRMSVTPGPTQT